MPITAYDLIKDQPTLTTISMDRPILDALTVMQQHDYSQLPIVTADGKQQGIITSESILKTQRNLGASLDKLKVQHAATNAPLAGPEDNIFDVFEHFNKHSAVLVVDNEGNLKGIITPWDAATHLHQRTEDLMLIEDIEAAIKEHIQASFTDKKTGLVSQADLFAAVTNILDHSEQRAKDVFGALKRYLSRAEVKHNLNADLVYEAFEKFIHEQRQQRLFDDLTLNQYIELLLNSDRWPGYSQVFDLDKEHFLHLLSQVRDIRNQLAHFRDEVSVEQRNVLRFCRNLFERHPAPAFTLLVSQVADSVEETAANEIEPLDDELSPGESRYARLALYLQQLPRKKQNIDLTFEEVEHIIEGELPPSAWQHRSWWANDSVSHVQSQQWLDAGWRVIRVNLSETRVAFARSEDRNQLYIRFFSELVNKLRDKNSFELRDVNPIGVSWVNVAALPRSGKRHPASLTYSFTRGRRFRVELYFDVGHKDKNKKIFEMLYKQRDAIEKAMGTKLEWEKLVTRRASRVAIYADGSIEDGEEKLAALQEWAVDTMLRFEKAIVSKAEAAVKAVS